MDHMLWNIDFGQNWSTNGRRAENKVYRNPRVKFYEKVWGKIQKKNSTGLEKNLNSSNLQRQEFGFFLEFWDPATNPNPRHPGFPEMGLGIP